MTTRRPLAGALAVVVVTWLSACGGDGKNGAGTNSTAPASKVLEGMFDVGDHELHLRCEGSGTPTVVYLHGLSHTEDAGEANAASAASLPASIARKHRFCAYDRANVGESGESAAR